MKNKFRDCMLDIETLGTGTDPVMIQLAAVLFDRETGECGQELCVNISEESCLEAGFQKDEKTIAWWASQDPTILQAIRTNPKSAAEAITDFYRFLRGASPTINIWSHATFDFVIVQSYLKKFNLPLIPHRNARDIRTLTSISGIDLRQYNWDKKTHNALDDCKFQIQYCVDAFKLLTSRKES